MLAMKVLPHEQRLGTIGNLRPRDDRNENDADDHGAFYLVRHEHDGQYATAEDANPQSWIAHLFAGAVAEFIEELRRTATYVERRRVRPSDSADTRWVRQANNSKEEPDATGARNLEGSREDADEPLAHSQEGQGNEDPALHEDRREGKAVRNGSCAVETNDLVGEVSVEAHSRTVWSSVDHSHRVYFRGNPRQGNGKVCE